MQIKYSYMFAGLSFRSALHKHKSYFFEASYKLICNMSDAEIEVEEVS
jgi:hypothetical protein